MKNVIAIGLSLLATMTVACSAETAPGSDDQGKQSSPVTGEADVKPAPAPAPAPAPGPLPGPAPGPTCTPIAGPSGGPGVGLANPASVYCSALGYAALGSDCKFPDGTTCEQWAFYRGECGQAHSFCNLHGGSVANKTEDMGGWTASYAQCTLPGGKQCQDSTFAQTCTCE